MEKLLNINSIKICTETFGNEADRAIILIAGAMAPLVFWPANFCQALAASGRLVIRFDNRDVGYSTHFEPCRPDSSIKMPYSIDDMVEDVAGILNHFKIKKAIIAGHSLGSTIAQLFAIKYPERVDQLFLLSSPIIAHGDNKYVETDARTKRQMWKILLSNKMHQDYIRGKDEFFKVWRCLNGNFELDGNMAAEYTQRLYATERIEPAWNHTKAQERIPDIFMELNALPIKKHFIYGEMDYLATNPQNIKILTDSLDNADLEVLTGAGHMFFNQPLWERILNIFECKIESA